MDKTDFFLRLLVGLSKGALVVGAAYYAGKAGGQNWAGCIFLLGMLILLTEHET